MNDNNNIRKLEIDSTLWAEPAKLVNLLDSKPEKLNIKTENNDIKVHQVRYENSGFYLVIDDIKGYFNLDDNTSGILDMIFTDDQKNKYHQVWKEVFKNVNGGNGELKLHEKIRLFNSNLPIEKFFKIPSITIAIKSLIEKDNKFYLELALNHCLYVF